MEAASALRRGEDGSAAVLAGLLRSAVVNAVATAGCAVLQLLVAMESRSCNMNDSTFDHDGEDGRFNLPVAMRMKNHGVVENKDDGETDEDEDEDDEEDGDDQEEDGGEEEFSGDEDNENDGEEDGNPEANGEGSEDDDEEDEEDDDDDGDEEEEEEDDEDDEDEEEEQPPSKKRK